MDHETTRKVRSRMKRIEGQVSGIQRMIDDDRYCIDILQQIAAARAALTECGKIILAAHVETCVMDTLEKGNRRERRRKLEELVDLFSRHGRS